MTLKTGDEVIHVPTGIHGVIVERNVYPFNVACRYKFITGGGITHYAIHDETEFEPVYHNVFEINTSKGHYFVQGSKETVYEYFEIADPGIIVCPVKLDQITKYAVSRLKELKAKEQSLKEELAAVSQEIAKWKF